MTHEALPHLGVQLPPLLRTYLTLSSIPLSPHLVCSRYTELTTFPGSHQDFPVYFCLRAFALALALASCLECSFSICLHDLLHLDPYFELTTSRKLSLATLSQIPTYPQLLSCFLFPMALIIF